jgi:hypothetical protein
MPPNIPGKKSISVIIPEDLYEAIKSWAETKEWSLSKAARKLIEIGFDTEMGTAKKPVKPAKGK